MTDLNPIVSRMLGAPIVRNAFTETPLQGGTLGDVRLYAGSAETAAGETLPFQIVHKIQRKWLRTGDAPSWRREYDLYTSSFGEVFEDGLRWPDCYHAEIADDEIQLFMAYLDGPTGKALSLSDLTQTAVELGRLQGRIYRDPTALAGMDFLGDVGYFAREYARWTPDTAEARYLYAEDCPLPAHLRRMIIDAQRDSARLFEALGRLPIVLNHRDVWIANLFRTGGRIRLIDWDGAGWGYLGEDMASLIVDDIDPDRIPEYARRLVPAYLEGLAESMEVKGLVVPIRELILIKFGYRFVQAFKYARSEAEREEAHAALQRIYEMEAAGI